MSIMLLTSAAGIVATCAAFVVYEFSASRRHTLEQVSTMARIIATNSTAALAFNDTADATQVLAVLRTEPSIATAALYDANGKLFAHYSKDPKQRLYPATARGERYEFSGGYLQQFVSVREQTDQELGTLFIRSDLTANRRRLWLYVAIAGAVMSVSLLLTYFLSRLLQQRISVPLLSLADTARAISERGDFSVRAPLNGEGEFVLLTTAFNRMLAAIDTQSKALTESEARLRATVDSALSAVVLMDSQGLITEWNPRAESIFGWSRHEALGRVLGDTIVPPRHREAHHAGVERFLTTGEGPILGRTVEMTALRRDGSEFPVELAIVALQDQAPLSFCGFATDITERKQARSRLQTQLARLDLLQRTTHAIGERQDLHSIFQVILRNLEDNMPIEFGCVCLHDQARHTLTIATIGGKSAVLAHRAGIEPDAQIQLQLNGFSKCVEGVLVFEPDISLIPHPFLQQLARAGLCSLVAAPMTVESRVFGVLLAARREAGGFGSADCEFLKQLSEHVALAAHQVQLYTDLQQAYEDLKLSQQTILQQERLRALGQMASGVAHDINNAISPVALYTESLLEREPNLSDRAREYLRIIQRAIADVGQTVARMREFYRQRDRHSDLEPIELNALVQQALTLTRARWCDMPQERGIVIQARTELAPELPRILGTESDIRDALTNLIFNAVDAMPTGGTLKIRTRAANATADHSATTAPPSVELEVIDTGVGMDEVTRRRCLEPFFTTKGERGTGMGLAMVYGMAERHNGRLEIDSAPGAGTTMRLRFLAATASGTAEVHAPTLVQPTRRLRLLVVDDDPLLSEALLRILESEGHDVTVAEGGQQGIDAFAVAVRSRTRFDLVLTDLGMPYVDGRAVAAAVKGASPETPVLLLTGWGHRLNTEQTVPDNVDVVLSKPPRLSELRQVLADMTASRYGTNH
jgi:PAS domain S-box-containing protein